MLFLAALRSASCLIRFRLTVTYSAVLIALSALLLGGVYLALAQDPRSETAEPDRGPEVLQGPRGQPPSQAGTGDPGRRDLQPPVRGELQTLQTLRNYSAAGMAGLFLVSLGTGWWLSGRALRPVRRITATARGSVPAYTFSVLLLRS